MTQSTPRTPSGAPAAQALIQRRLDEWIEAADHGVRKRVRLEKLITARGVFKPFTLAQRFMIKVREVGLLATVRLVSTRLRQLRQEAR